MNELSYYIIQFDKEIIFYLLAEDLAKAFPALISISDLSSFEPQRYFYELTDLLTVALCL